VRYNKITISGKICTGKSTLFQNLCHKLGWPTISTGQFFRDYVKDKDLSIEGAEEQNEKLTKEVDYQVRDKIRAPGKLIIDGWLSGMMAKGSPDVLKILLICKDDIRYRRFAKREKVTFLRARERVEERQKSWFAKIKKIHKIDSTKLCDPKNYDLVIDTSYITPQAILRIVLKTITQKN